MKPTRQELSRARTALGPGVEAHYARAGLAVQKRGSWMLTEIGVHAFALARLVNGGASWDQPRTIRDLLWTLERLGLVRAQPNGGRSWWLLWSVTPKGARLARATGAA